MIKSSRPKRMTKSASLRNRGPTNQQPSSYYEGSDHPPRLSNSKQVQFRSKVGSWTEDTQNRSPNLTTNNSVLGPSKDVSASEALTLDAFYQELIKKERQQFERILKSKTNVARSDATKKLRKQIADANRKHEKVSELERNLSYAKNNNEKLRVEWDYMKGKVKST